MPRTTTSNPQTPSGQAVFTTAPVEAQTGNPAMQPIWIRLPKSRKLCPYTGLSRSSMNALILGNNPPVKSVSHKKRYAVRGVRLIHLGSLLEYIESLAAAQQAETSTTEDGATKSAPNGDRS